MCYNNSLDEFTYVFDVVEVRLEPVLDSDLDSRCRLLKSLEQSLVCSGVSIHDRVFKVLNQGMLVALLDQPLYHLVCVKQVFRALNVVLQLILQIHTLAIRVNSVLKVLLFVGLNR